VAVLRRSHGRSEKGEAMNVRETWVVYDYDGRPRSVFTSEIGAWRIVHAKWGSPFSEYVMWLRDRIDSGWRCLRVVPAEGQEGTT
jgi:hypothetical protein